MNRTPLHAVTALSGVLLIALMAACGAGPKGDALAELEALRASNYARQVRIDPEEVEHPRIREMRESFGESPAEFGGRLSMREDQVEALERGELGPTTSQIDIFVRLSGESISSRDFEEER